jgi:hypothetical protein
MVEGDPHRFETMARQVAAIPVTGEARTVRTADEAGLRPASFQPLRVEVMDPHDLWDARDAGLRGALEQAAPRMIEAAAPAIAEAVVQRVKTEATSGLRAALPSGPRTTIQLGAFSSKAAAEAAWTAVARGAGRGAMAGLSPVFEGVEVNGKRFTRLKVGPIPAEAAESLCRAAEVTDPWCRRSA